MDSRERVIVALEHKEPDRVPLDLGTAVSTMTVQAYTALKDHLGLTWIGEGVNKQWMLMTTLDERILKKFHIDVRGIGLSGPPPIEYPHGTFRDEWGLPWKAKGVHNWIAQHPLKGMENVDQIDEYQWPDLSIDRTKGLEKKVRELEDSGWAVIASSPYGGILETAQWLRSYEKVAIDMFAHQDILDALLDKILEIQIELYRQLLDVAGDHIQICQTCDDLGWQHGPIMSPNSYRRFLKPRHKKLFDFIRSKTDAKIFMHSCGSVKPFIEDFIEIGLDILNPVQPLADSMDSETLKSEYGGRLSFHGGIDIQKALPFESVAGVKDEVSRRIKAFAPGGGYILAPAHNIQPEVPPESLIALYDAAYNLGKYPLNL